MLITTLGPWKILHKVHSPSLKWKSYARDGAYWSRGSADQMQTGLTGTRDTLIYILDVLFHRWPPVSSSYQVNYRVELEVSKSTMKSGVTLISYPSLDNMGSGYSVFQYAAECVVGHCEMCRFLATCVQEVVLGYPATIYLRPRNPQLVMASRGQRRCVS
ncbi:hypothetical protein BASA83_010192 [Batrachochytrium salamandrivorans]|nr:hypothetical protein BASA83_010192 [Batrachochytrium salamandrivorans]